MTCYARPVLFLILIITAGLAALGYTGVLTAVAVTLMSAVLTAVLIIRDTSCACRPGRRGTGRPSS
jgi:hypothetical protein